MSLPSRSTVLLCKAPWRGRGPDDEDDYGSRKSLRSASPTPLEADRPLNKIKKESKWATRFITGRLAAL